MRRPGSEDPHWPSTTLNVIPEITDLSWCSSLDTVLVLIRSVLIKNIVITVVVGSVGTSLLHQEHGPSIGHDGLLAEDGGGGEEEEEEENSV